MKYFFVFVVFALSSIATGSTNTNLDILDAASAEDVRGFVSNSILNNVVRNLTPQDRRQIRETRQSIIETETEMKELRKEIDQSERRLSNKSKSFQRAQRKRRQYERCMKGKAPSWNGCGKKSEIEQNFDENRGEVNEEKSKLRKLLDDYERLRKLLQKLKRLLKNLLAKNGPKPSVYPRPKGKSQSEQRTEKW